MLNSFNEIVDNTVGRYIGILERFLIAVFIILQAYPGLVILGAFKTLTRFKQLEDIAFAENYLIGTLLSILLTNTVWWINIPNSDWIIIYKIIKHH